MDIDLRAVEFLRRNYIQEALEESNFEYIYEELERAFRGHANWIISDVTEMFLASGINPLIGMTEVPEYFLCEGGIEAFIIPQGVETICYKAFSNCRKLKSITIPNTVKEIEDLAFSWCTSLQEIIFQGTVSEWRKLLKYPKAHSYKLYFNSAAPKITVRCVDKTTTIEGEKKEN